MAKAENKLIGNKFWQLRSKHGRDKIFATAEILWDAACEYFQWCEDNPLKEEQAMKIKVDRDTEEIKMIQLSKLRPFTMHGLCNYLGVNTKYFFDFEEVIKDKQDKASKDFSEVCTRIREIIYNQKFTGATVGFFNANIIARDLGLADKSEIENKTIVVKTEE